MHLTSPRLTFFYLELLRGSQLKKTTLHDLTILPPHRCLWQQPFDRETIERCEHLMRERTDQLVASSHFAAWTFFQYLEMKCSFCTNQQFRHLVKLVKLVHTLNGLPDSRLFFQSLSFLVSKSKKSSSIQSILFQKATEKQPVLNSS